MTKSIKITVRSLAVQILTKVLHNGEYSNKLINDTLQRKILNDADQRLLSQLVYGVLQHKLTLDYELALYIKDKKLVSWVQNVLRVAVYQLKYLDRIPDRAVLFEATQLAKEQGNPGLAKLVTAVLRNLQRHGWRDLGKLTPEERWSIEYSVPKWVIKELLDQVGSVKTKTILQSLNHSPRTSLRVNSAKITRTKLQASLRSDGLDVHPSSISDLALVSDHGFVAGSSWFQAGYCTIQDESSMLVAPALQIESTDHILDACAAPGGKTTQMASLLNSQGHVTALDLHAKKLKLIQRNAQRLGVADKITTEALDARQVGQNFSSNSFDRILVDAPCSGFGLMRRKPEIRYGRQLADVKNLAKIQQEILSAVAPLLKVQGYLVYSTCTIFEQENSQVIEQFLATHSDYRRVLVYTHENLEKNICDQMLKIYPDDYQTDGFFIACLQRVK
ncbi:16S rRNA (cytosine(967)-C(5))-methyltransferase RsmB [Bombilactobacillus folatiphilus]|uniref:16S rRNA (cytosine(967)-C(5))-methyltransferase n=1 Tax=Bombilactobacillus folatiphilus TaxID=2923362 RepID=A0ABY4P7D5_9LACO|nr:16S rRNA (cytosine(967)-C(5))-methyltransferase RsmB [Bombilactobacillus folatiphilus]UQS81618.1 16S rRNA (cytosine(967)-C(5))-methyltransferase RsmB [Bombilactobacillus folatiphilus]